MAQNGLIPERRDISIDGPDIFLNLAAAVKSTGALGPGRRAALWTQGCVFHCPGCVAPDWIPIQPAHLITVDVVLDFLLGDPHINGITISGGEPMLQASALARLVRMARRRRDLDVICFTGFQRSQLERTPPFPGISDLLNEVDVLIDGPYIARLNDNIGLRGSSNQRIHYLSDRLRGADLEHWNRRSEICLLEGQAVMVGVPPLTLGEAFNQANELKWDLLNYERV